MFLPNTDSFLLIRGTIVEPVFTPLEVAAPRSSGLAPEARARLLTGFTPEIEKDMFLPNSHSFILVRSVISKPVIQSGIQKSARSELVEPATSLPSFPPPDYERRIFLPNTDSFLLIQGTIVKPGFSIFLPNKNSFLLTRRGSIVIPTPILEETGVGAIPQLTAEEQSKINDRSKRNFLRVVSIAGGSIASSLLFPKKADALILGSSPTTGVVGVKNASNVRINPATEETASLLLKTSDLTFDTGSLKVKSFSNSADAAQSGRVDDATRHVYVDVKDSVLPTAASTETTLETISFGGFKFTVRLAMDSGDSNIEYVGEANIGTETSEELWRIKKVDSTSGIVVQYAGAGDFQHAWDGREGFNYS